LAVWHGGQVGCVNTWTRFAMLDSTRRRPLALQKIASGGTSYGSLPTTPMFAIVPPFVIDGTEQM
jgi:hypothetical protein